MVFAVDTAALGCYTARMNNDDIDPSMDSLTPVTYKFSNSGTTNTVLSVGSNGIDWSSLPYTINTSATAAWNTNNNNITLNGDGADIRVNGKSLSGAIDAIERRLAILQPNPEIEKEWEELQQLGNRYRELEAQIKAKMQVWDVLKKTDI